MKVHLKASTFIFKVSNYLSFLDYVKINVISPNITHRLLPQMKIIQINPHLLSSKIFGLKFKVFILDKVIKVGEVLSSLSQPPQEPGKLGARGQASVDGSAPRGNQAALIVASKTIISSRPLRVGARL